MQDGTFRKVCVVWLRGDLVLRLFLAGVYVLHICFGAYSCVQRS